METTAFASPPTSSATADSPAGLWQSRTKSARCASSALVATASPPTSSASCLGAIRQQIRAEHRLSPSPDERPGHVAAADEADHDWLKKPFSMSLARSSAEISTLRGVSMNTLSAIRCMPPSRA